MRTLLVYAGLFGVVAFAAQAEPRKIWETDGFKNPESVIYDAAGGAIYVSNVNGDPAAKDGNGHISKLRPDGKAVALEWVTGLDAPKGLAIAGGKLYAADIDQLVEIDLAKGTVSGRYAAPGAKFLNDLTADAKGRVFASDIATNTIWLLEDGKFSAWLQDEALESPNGLLAESGRIVVGAWGKMEPDFSTKVPGRLKVIDLATKTISDLGDPAPVGNIDGVVSDGKGGYVVSDWPKGGLFHVGGDGKATRLLALKQGSADIGAGPDGTVIVPMMVDGTVAAYKLD